MRKATEDVYSAFISRRNYSKGNTRVEIHNGESYMYLFDNLIAKTENGNTMLNHCGYTTATTAERLNSFDVRIRRSGGKFIVNEEFVWKDGWLTINQMH